MTPTIVVPLQGAPEAALRCLESLAALPEAPAHEVVVVDDGAVGLDPLLARLEGDVLVVRCPRRVGFGAAAARALEHVDGAQVVLLRDAPRVDPGFLAPLLGALDAPGVAAATSVASGAGEHPVLARALAARTEDLRRPGVLSAEVPDALAMAAVVAGLAAGGGRVAPVTASLVHPAGARTAGARKAPGRPVELSVVIPTLDASAERVRAAVARLQATTEASHEIVVIDNGAPPQGFTAPVNAGVRAAGGRYVVVLNDDVLTEPGWWPPLRAALDAGAAVAFPTTIDGAMRTDFAAWCFAFSREELAQIGFGPDELFDPDLVVWYQDTDLLVRLREQGRPPVWVRDAHIRHGLSETVASEDPDLRGWVLEQVARDRAAFERKHGTGVPGAGRAA